MSKAHYENNNDNGNRYDEQYCYCSVSKGGIGEHDFQKIPSSQTGQPTDTEEPVNINCEQTKELIHHEPSQAYTDENFILADELREPNSKSIDIFEETNFQETSLDYIYPTPPESPLPGKTEYISTIAYMYLLIISKSQNSNQPHDIYRYSTVNAARKRLK